MLKVKEELRVANDSLGQRDERDVISKMRVTVGGDYLGKLS